jgi:hypothetical protein
MSLRSLVRRRPSAPLVVSFLALFVALGGASWAAFRLPVHSVGNAQLQNFSVGNAKLRPNSVGAGKIMPGAVGSRQVDSSQVQLRVSGPCSLGAIQSIAASGNVTCTPALPAQYGTSASNVTVGTQSTLIADKQLSAGPGGSSYLVVGNVQWTVSGHPQSSQSVDLKCAIFGSSSPGGEATAELDATGTMRAGTMPLVAPATITGSHGDGIITCAFTATPADPAPTVTVNATINAIQTASNG